MAQLRDIMTTKVLTTSAERPVAEVTAMMVKARVGSAVVLQGSWLAGILTERDVLRAAASRSDLTTSPISQWLMVQEHTVELPDGRPLERPHLPHRLICTSSAGDRAEIVAVVKTQGSDTKLVGQLQPYDEVGPRC